MAAKPVITSPEEPAGKGGDLRSRTLQKAKERLRASVIEAGTGVAEAVRPRQAMCELREATWGVLDKAVERRGQSSLSGETGDYDFSGLTDRELAQEMLAEFPELLVEARRMLELPPEEAAGL